MSTTPPPDGPPLDSTSPEIVERRAHALFLRQSGRVSGPFPRRLLDHYRLLGRIAERDELSEDRVAWSTVQDVLGERNGVRAAVPVPSSDERDWLEERRMARMRWIDERSGEDRRQGPGDIPDKAGRSAGDRRGDWTPGQGGAKGAVGVIAPAPAQSHHAQLTVAAVVLLLVGLGLGLWLFAPRLVPHITLLR